MKHGMLGMIVEVSLDHDRIPPFSAGGLEMEMAVK